MDKKLLEKYKEYRKTDKAIDALIMDKKKDLLNCKDDSSKLIIENQLTNLMELSIKESDMKRSKKRDIDWKTITTSAVSLASILIILNYEKEDIITSKAFGIATKLFK